MKIRFVLFLFVAILAHTLAAQQRCASFDYMQSQLGKNPSLQGKMDAIERFTQNSIKKSQNIQSRLEDGLVIRIPVVVHILYHEPGENISDSRVMEQIAALNRDYRRMNTDTVNTPNYFKQFAADSRIEFRLAISDPQQRSTTGIIRKYTPIAQWEGNDKMKFSSSYGDDAWDADSYLNIWVCNLKGVLGYSSFIGGPANLDGVVISNSVFGQTGTFSAYDKGRTAVHEVGHWLNLKHLWGDTDCGDDQVADTPPQSTFTMGCPSGMKVSCNNSPTGNMYMNYMDFTYDDCMNMFTKGQMDRMRAQFDEGGPRSLLLFSQGLNTPLVYQTEVPDSPPKWLHPQLYPNPATIELNLDLVYDIRWLGKTVTIFNSAGQVEMQFVINSKYQKIDISRLPGGLYLMSAKKEDGATIREKFIKI